ncbi:MAG: hemin ABC transporter substrate-binding protein, partial [Myxococcaceae bacterium]
MTARSTQLRARSARALLLLSVLAWTGGAAALPKSSFIGPPVKKVKRVVTLAPSLTDIVLAVGAGESLVGVSRFDEDERVAKVARVGGFSDPSVEAV